MSKFALKNPYFIVVACLMVAIVGTTILIRMPVDLFPPIKIPVVVVATFYSGMAPEEIETDITGRLFREFAVTLAVTIVVSAVVSLTLTPMMSSRLLRRGGIISGTTFSR